MIGHPYFSSCGEKMQRIFARALDISPEAW
jgi:hypothetical protein